MIRQNCPTGACNLTPLHCMGGKHRPLPQGNDSHCVICMGSRLLAPHRHLDAVCDCVTRLGSTLPIE